MSFDANNYNYNNNKHHQHNYYNNDPTTTYHQHPRRRQQQQRRRRRSLTVNHLQNHHLHNVSNVERLDKKVTGFCRSPQETRKASPTGSVTSSVSNAALTPSRQLTDAEKLRKVILELVDTEKTYVKVSS